MDSGEESPSEVSEVAVGQKAPKAEPTDSGAFNLSDVCVALSGGDLDKRRMRRPKDGFLGLLNQSM